MGRGVFVFYLFLFHKFQFPYHFHPNFSPPGRPHFFSCCGGFFFFSSKIAPRAFFFFFMSPAWLKKHQFRPIFWFGIGRGAKKKSPGSRYFLRAQNFPTVLF